MEKLGSDIPQIKPHSVLEPVETNDIPKITPETMPVNTHTHSTHTKKVTRRRRVPKPVLIGLAVFLVVIGLFGLVLGVPAMATYKHAKVLEVKGRELKASIATNDISVVKAQLQSFEGELAKFQKTFKGMALMKPLPWLGAYYRDGENGIQAGLYGIEAGKLLLETVEPYADIIGFKGAASKVAASGAENANNRLEFIVQTIKDITPKMGVISEKAGQADKLLRTIDPSRYPEDFRGKKVRAQLTELLTMAEQGTSMLAQSKPLVEQAPYLLGVDETRRYLMIFQNDNELRPTGGFLSAYSIVDITKGKFKPVSSSDIYILDAKYTPSIPAPDIFREFLGGIYAANNRFRLRDMNWSPDFRTSMEMFVPEAKKAGLTGYDGIIVVNTKVLQRLLNVIGTIGVPGFGNFGPEINPECNCPGFLFEIENYTSQEGAVVWSENEPGKIVFAPKNYGKNRKDILGELMNSVLANTLGQSKENLPKLFEAGWTSVMAHDIQMYMFEPKAQEALEGFNLAGRMRQYEGDYLHINNANLGGRKSNLYVEYEVAQTFKKGSDGRVEKTLEITYKNPQKQDGFLNSVLPNWTRIYVPKGSELVKAEGFETPGETAEEFDKTVFSGGFKLRPEGLKKVTITYKLPMKVGNSLPLLIQKQGGVPTTPFTIVSGRQQEEIMLSQDHEVTVRF